MLSLWLIRETVVDRVTAAALERGFEFVTAHTAHLIVSSLQSFIFRFMQLFHPSCLC